ncbi:tripartite tricarboxylate transporter TctB family protein [Ancylobacter defluvii]|uniref:Tripartite tricarboxylate transporter TctB n=1 Tax=Ancylobacter defluvii TaxID=1282440 RepID=A0A9W6K1L1_9HYPH|nr:tripartite tricarboxylate transporter TctB family protein [Ancylobacter defluvii]MBS7586531.1 tripartite tricarboxylate transporter TctB family protein [Ancylobacter defluvii]GLK85819.1 tripartite tricarboxylate transporter TctB [Ancylobacter defluvii]
MRSVTGRRFDWPDLLFGLFLIAVAAGTFAATWRLAGGTAADMGPGYMPRAIALALLGFGLFFTGRGLVRSYAGIERVQLRPILGVGASVGVFALLIESAGLAAAAFAAIVIAAVASRESRFFEVILFGLFVTAAAVLLFVKALALPVAIWPW